MIFWTLTAINIQVELDKPLVFGQIEAKNDTASGYKLHGFTGQSDPNVTSQSSGCLAQNKINVGGGPVGRLLLRGSLTVMNHAASLLHHPPPCSLRVGACLQVQEKKRNRVNYRLY